MQSTLQLFHLLFEHLPPLVPQEVVLAMRQEIEKLEADPRASLEQIEESMIRFGYEVWPWNQAYKYFLQIAEDQLGEHFLLPVLSQGLQNRYLDFKAFGGTLADLHSGRPASFFSSDDRGELCEKLVEMRMQLRQYLNRDLVGLHKKRYILKVAEYQELLEKIKFNLESLRNFVEKEEDGSGLIGEIQAKIKDFEHSLCLLGSEMDYEAVCQAHDFFTGRKVELNRLRGIHIPMQIDFYNS